MKLNLVILSLSLLVSVSGFSQLTGRQVGDWQLYLTSGSVAQSNAQNMNTITTEQHYIFGATEGHAVVSNHVDNIHFGSNRGSVQLSPIGAQSPNTLILPRNAYGNEDEFDDDEDGNDIPDPFPIGDAVWLLVLMSAMYLLKLIKRNI